MGLSILRIADGLVTLVNEVNLEGASLLVRKAFGLRAEGAGGRCDLFHQTGYSQRCLHLNGFWQDLKLCDTYLTFCQLRPGGIYVANQWLYDMNGHVGYKFHKLFG